MSGFYDGVNNVWIVRVGMRGKGLDIDGHKDLDDAAFHLLCMDSWKTDTKQRMLDFKARIDAHLKAEADEEAFHAARDALIDKAPKKCPDCGCEELHTGSVEDQGEAVCCTECDWFVSLRSLYSPEGEPDAPA
jgi:hypothetical protein